MASWHNSVSFEVPAKVIIFAETKQQSNNEIMKKKKDNKGFVENEKFNESCFDGYVESKKQSYLPFYDDVRSVKLEAEHDISEEERSEIISSFMDTAGCHRKPLFIEMFDSRKMFFLVSKKFKDDAEKMVKGSKVEYRNPNQPDRHDVAVVKSDGIRYEGGVPVFDLWVEPRNCVDVAKGNDLGPYFAIFWRPLEEGKPNE